MSDRDAPAGSPGNQDAHAPGDAGASPADAGAAGAGEQKPEPGLGSPEQLRRVWGAVRIGLRGLYRSQLPRMAAALSYRTIFSLVPMLVVGIAVTGAFVKGDRLEVFSERVFDYIGISSIEVQGPATTGEAGGEEQDGAMVSQLEGLLTQIIERVQTVSFEAIGILGVLFLIYAAMAMLMELERAFNTICHAPRGRSWARRVTTYWTTLTLGAVFLIATFYVSDVAASWLVGLGEVPQAGDDTAETTSWISRNLVEAAINITLTAALLLLAYTTVPNARVDLRPAIAGALVASLIWALGKWGFTGYVRNAAGLEKLYGAIALLPLFLMWIYLTWLIVLFGLQIAYMLQTFDELRAEFEPGQEEDEELTFVDPVAGLELMVGVGRKFVAGEPAKLRDLALGLSLDERAAAKLVDKLIAAGHLRRTDGTDRALLPARPVDAIRAGEVLAASEELVCRGPKHGDAGAAASAVCDRIHRARLDALGERTVGELLRGEGWPAPDDRPPERAPGHLPGS